MMKQMLAFALCGVLCVTISQAQSKVFKEVSDEISSQMKVISQDDALIGYLVFTRLEKASEDSFNYKISIMDENLNDIGSVNFREESLDLKAVSFEQDVLCLAYVKSNLIGNNFQNSKAYKRAADKAKHAVVTQFINLEGKILQANAYNVAITTSETYGYTGSNLNAHLATGNLKHFVQLKNIGQKGFVCFYGDNSGNNLIAFSSSGKELWKSIVPDAKAFGLLTAGPDLYLLSKEEDKMVEGGYKVTGYSSADGKQFAKQPLKDKKGNSLKVLDFEKDPVSGRPILTGYIINHSHGNKYGTARHVTTGTYDGVFSIALNGHGKNEVKETYSYWGDGTQSPSITSRGKFAENESYPRFSETVRDEKGNTYFVGSSFIKKTKWGAIGAAVVLAPLIVVSPMIIGLGGTQKYKVKDAMVLKQSANGSLSFDNAIACDDTRFYPHRTPVFLVDTKSFYTVYNANKNTRFLIVDDVKNIVIYNINTKKVVRTVPHKDGQVRTNIFPAKEGYMMVSEYNKKEKYTKLSIEAL